MPLDCDVDNWLHFIQHIISRLIGLSEIHRSIMVHYNYINR